MKGDTRVNLIEALTSEQNKKRFERGQRFELISGGGMGKRLQHLFITPDIYIPYLLFMKAGLSHFQLSKVRLFWGRTIRIPLRDYDYFKLYMYGSLGSYEAELRFIKFLCKSLGPNDVFYDIGANRGFYAYLAAAVCKEAHSFEPTIELTDVIRDNVHKDERFFVNEEAVSDVDGTIDFYTVESDVMNTIKAPQADIISARTHSAIKKVSVPSVTIDTYITTHTKPTVLKIDAEGAEEQILKGGEKFFSSEKPTVVMEILGKENSWELSMRAAEKLGKMGYKSYRINSEGDIEKVEGDLSTLVAPAGGENFVFKK